MKNTVDLRGVREVMIGIGSGRAHADWNNCGFGQCDPKSTSPCGVRQRNPKPRREWRSTSSGRYSGGGMRKVREFSSKYNSRDAKRRCNSRSESEEGRQSGVSRRHGKRSAQQLSTDGK